MAALAAPNGVFEHAGDSESNRSAFSQLVQSLSALPDLQDLLTNQSLPPRDLAAQLRAADGMLREMSGIVGKANEDLFALDPSTSTDASAPLPPLPDILLQPNKRQRTRQAPSLPGNPSLAVQPQARPRPRLIPASARQRRVLSRSEISAVLESASDQAGSSGCAISSEGIEELDVGLCKGSLTLEIGNLAKGTCHFGPRTTADGQRCTVVYRVTLGAVSEKLGPHQSSRFKSFQDLSVHLTGLELDVVQFVERIPLYTDLAQKTCFYCSQLLRSGVLPLGRAWACDTGATLTRKVAPNGDPGNEGLQATTQDGEAGEWVAFHTACQAEVVPSEGQDERE